MNSFIKEEDKKLVSIVIPAYKAQDFIKQSLLRVVEVMDATTYPYEVICVVDGRLDRTFEKAEEVAKRYPGKVRVIGYKNNLGKGYAVRYGMARAKGEIVGFIDAGFDINPNGISMLLDHFEWYKADIIVGSKRHPVSKVIYPWQRKIVAAGGQLIVRILFGLNVRDTQVGIKFFKRKVLEKVLPRLLVKRWAFDIEMLCVANYLGFSKIYEAPVEIKMKFEGASIVVSGGYIRTVLGTLWDTLAIFYRLRILHYYDSENRKNWITPRYLTFRHGD